jgi:hypothetical protein
LWSYDLDEYKNCGHGFLHIDSLGGKESNCKKNDKKSFLQTWKGGGFLKEMNYEGKERG